MSIKRGGIARHLVSKVFQKMYLRATSRNNFTSLSDNQVYPEICLQASHDYTVFTDFRRNPIYNEILEHVSEEQGEKYLELITKDAEILKTIDRFKQNDVY